MTTSLSIALRTTTYLTQVFGVGGAVASIYAANGFEPPIIADFGSTAGAYGAGYYEKNSVEVAEADLIDYDTTGLSTVTDSDGALKWAAHNLFLNSETDTDYVGFGSGLSAASTESAIYGLTGTGFRVVDDGLGGTNRVAAYRVQTFPDGESGSQLLVKKGSHTWMFISYGSMTTGGGCYFNLDSGVIGTNTMSGTPTISAATDGWWLIYIPHNSAGADVLGRYYVEISAADNSIAGVTCDGTAELHVNAICLFNNSLGGMQDNPHNETTGLESYVPTTSAASYMRRANYVYNGSTWAGPYAQVESAQATNLCTESNDFTTTWSMSQAGSFTLTAANGTGPDGNTSLTKVEVTDTTNETHGLLYNISGVSGTNYVCSAVVSYGDQQYVGMTLSPSGENFFAAVFDLAAGTQVDTDVGTTSGTLTSSGIVDLGNGLYRIWISGSTTVTDTTTPLILGSYSSATPSYDTRGRESYAGTGGEYFHAGFVDIVAASSISSHIPTAGSTVTRSAQTMKILAADLSTWNTSAMSYAMKATGVFSGSQRFFSFYQDNNNRGGVLRTGTSNTSGFIRTAGSNQTLGVDGAIADGISEQNLAWRVTTSAGQLAFSGVVGTESTGSFSYSATTPYLIFGKFAAGGSELALNINLFRAWAVDIGDTGIEEASALTFTDEFAMLITTTGADETFTIPCRNVGTFDAGIEWGDGSVSSISAYNDAGLAHTYATAGDYVVRIRGTFPNIYFNNGGDKLKVTKVLNLGDVGWTRLDEAFYGCSNMTEFTVGTTDTSAVTNMSNMIRDCAGLTSLNLSSFDTGLVTSMLLMFYGCSSLTSLNLSSFDTGLVTSMYAMFFNCTSLTSLDVSSFDTALVSNMTYMFYTCSSLTSLVGPEDFDITGLNSTGDLNSFMTSVPNGALDYDSLLVNWEAQVAVTPALQIALTPDFGLSKYSAGAPTTARADLLTAGWASITDGGAA